MSTIRQKVRETIKNYTDEYLEQLILNGEFIGIDTDGEISEISYERFLRDDDADADDMREAMLDFLDWLEEGFFDDEPGESLMADIVKNDVLYEWGADPGLLESYADKMSLMEYVKDYGVTEITKDMTDAYEWDTATRRLDLNRRCNGTIYQTNKWNSENPTFCIEWDCVKDPLQPEALDIYETEELLDKIEDGKVAYWNGDKAVTLGSDDDKSVVKEWLEKHDVSERRKYWTSDEYWKKLTAMLGLPESYNNSIYYTDAGYDFEKKTVFLLTVIDEDE